MHIYKVLPDLDKPRHMSIWHKAINAQWSPEEIDWNNPSRLRRDDLKDSLARILTPVLMGEQAALYSVTSMIHILGAESDTESQLYLTSMAMDEGRHVELFSRIYHRLARQPLPIRRMPSAYLFQSQIMSEVPSEWLTGSLVSEVIAKLTLEELKRLDLESVVTEVSTRVLADEARHLAFNHIFLEDHFWWRYRHSRADGEAWTEHLRARLKTVLDTIPPMLDSMDSDMQRVGIDGRALLQRLSEETHRRLAKSIANGEKKAEGRSAAQCVPAD